MRFGAMNFPVKPVIEEIEAFVDLGFSYLELAMDPPMAHYSLLECEKERIRAHLDKYGLGLICHLPTFVSTADLTESIRAASVDEVLRSLEVAARLGADKVVLHPSMVAGMGAFVIEQVTALAFDFLADVANVAEQLHITICLENMMPANIIGVEPEFFAEVFARFDAMQLTLDTGHANIGDTGGRRLNRLVRLFGDRIGHIHISDNNGLRDEHLAPGEGTVNFESLMDALREQDYRGSVTLEVFDPDRSRLVESRNRLLSLCRGTL